MSAPQTASKQETARFGAPLLIVLILGAVLLTTGRAPAQTDCDRAYTVFSQGRFTSSQQEAVEYYLDTIDLCPGFIRPFELVGNYYRKKGRDEAAVAYFTKAAELGTTNHKLFYLLAELLYRKNRLDEANHHLQKALDLKRDYPEALSLKETIDLEADNEGPKIMLFEPATRRSLRLIHLYESITVRGTALDKSGIAWVKINGGPVTFDEGGNFLKDVAIKGGKNLIVVAAADRAGNQSRTEVVVGGKSNEMPPLEAVQPVEQRGALYDNSLAVVIGINDYESWSALEFAVSDALEIERRLLQTGFGEVITILNREATQRRILSVLFHELPERVGFNDRVIIYFAGHGQTEELPDGGRRGYLIPADCDRFDYTAKAISMAQIRSLSRRIPAKHLLYIMDSCYSGLGLNRAQGVSPRVSDYLRKVAGMRSVQIVTAGGKGEQVQERKGHGLFTSYLLRALDGAADFNGDNVVTGTELGAYLRPAVSNASNQAQTPLYGRLEGEGEFLLFVNK